MICLNCATDPVKLFISSNEKMIFKLYFLDSIEKELEIEITEKITLDIPKKSKTKPPKTSVEKKGK